MFVANSVAGRTDIKQILDVDPEGEEDGANRDLDSMRKGKCAVIKTSTRQTVFLPLIGLVPAEQLKPQDLVGVNKDSYLVLDTLPAEFDSRVKAMEVDERPTETYTDIGGLEKQIEELVEAIVLPMEQADKFKTLGIKPPKGCLMYGPPGQSAVSFGKGNSIFLSRRPDRSRAGSRISIRFVAAITCLKRLACRARASNTDNKP